MGRTTALMSDRGQWIKSSASFGRINGGGLIHQFRTGDSGGNQSAIIGQGIPQKNVSIWDRERGGPPASDMVTGGNQVRIYRTGIVGENRPLVSDREPQGKHPSVSDRK
jgi:hypothetical protein